MALIATDPRLTSTAVRNLKSKTKALPNTSMQQQDAEFNTTGLPKAFLHSLRTLFDILDDGKRGYVHISEIETRWQGAETQDLPGGVLESLKRVTPPHGCLTFERFVSGLRYSILNPDKSHPQKHHFHPNGFKQQTHNKVRPLGPSNGTNVHRNHGSAQPNRAPQHYDSRSCAYTGSSKQSSNDSKSYPNPGVRTCTRTGRSLERVHVAPESAQNRFDSVRGGQKVQQKPTRVQSVESIPAESFPKTVSGQQQGEHVGLPRSQSETTTGFAATRRHSRSREEPRRHTITNSVDYGMLKQMKELEQEKDSLLSGLDVVERAREWYQSQIHNVNERQRLVGQSGHLNDFLSETNQSRLNVLLPKLQEVNRCLNELISCSGMLFPTPSTHSSVPSPSVQPITAPPQVIQRLKDQNHLLTQEVTEKSERITQLEQEKSALIKQLFEARARNAHDSSVLDSTFI
ncbi:Suppressor APC domain-containing protein 2 [Bagarius yarrelli]|uniref:Suppressor APC domain-containing protein 2 n=1 Tax=Bagarius yarrelli TaxID=175774 RepID=A0A556TYA5_BAGYA|nr:Suppressor APC domain-containing protein 2 [Bagarius yarrelli]